MFWHDSVPLYKATSIKTLFIKIGSPQTHLTHSTICKCYINPLHRVYPFSIQLNLVTPAMIYLYFLTKTSPLEITIHTHIFTIVIVMYSLYVQLCSAILFLRGGGSQYILLIKQTFDYIKLKAIIL